MYALVTGASAGIGKEIAKILSDRGYDLILTARSEDKLLQLQIQLRVQGDHGKAKGVKFHAAILAVPVRTVAKTLGDKENISLLQAQLLLLRDDAGFAGNQSAEVVERTAVYLGGVASFAFVQVTVETIKELCISQWCSPPKIKENYLII